MFFKYAVWEVFSLNLRYFKADKILQTFLHRFLSTLDLGTHLFVKVPRQQSYYIWTFPIGPRLGDSEVTFSVFDSSFHLLLSVQPPKVRGNSVKCLAEGHITQTCWLIFTLARFYAESQAGNCEYHFLSLLV